MGSQRVIAYIKDAGNLPLQKMQKTSRACLIFSCSGATATSFLTVRVPTGPKDASLTSMPWS